MIYQMTISSNPKLFAYDTSLFSVVHDKNISARELNNDLQQISNWAYQWKRSFNHGPSQTSLGGNFFMKNY